jgi:hypothetical protein
MSVICRGDEVSGSYFFDFNAMSSPIHFACSCVGVTSDVDEERRVVDGLAVFVVEADVVGEPGAMRHCRSTCSIG